jgi:protein ImuB
MADISGVPHLFGGEEALRADVLAGLCRAGLTAQCAIAGTRGAAYALARFAAGGIAAEGELAARLGPLPIAALRVDHDTVAALGRLGLGRIADLIPMPRAPLARRFGQGLILRLDQALGQRAEPVAAPPDEPHFAVRLTLPEPIGKQQDVMAGLARLLARLCPTLARHGMGARRLRLELRRVDGQSARLDIGLARPMREPLRIAALFAKGVDDVDAGFGIDALRLSATLVEPMPPEQIGGEHPPAGDANALADLISSLGNRIGFDRVLRLEPTQSLIPERSFQMVSAANMAPAAPPVPRRGPPRPAILFAPEWLSEVSGNPPTRFRWRRMSLTTQRAIGPERIAPEWWLDDPAWRTGLRDYWRIETQQGPRLWLFYTPQNPRWCVQGEFI